MKKIQNALDHLDHLGKEKKVLQEEIDLIDERIVKFQEDLFGISSGSVATVEGVVKLFLKLMNYEKTQSK